jgi:hypothetical protein
MRHGKGASAPYASLTPALRGSPSATRTGYYHFVVTPGLSRGLSSLCVRFKMDPGTRPG